MLVQMMAQMMSRMDEMRAEQASEREAMRVQIRWLVVMMGGTLISPSGGPGLPRARVVGRGPSSRRGSSSWQAALQFGLQGDVAEGCRCLHRAQPVTHNTRSRKSIFYYAPILSLER